MTLPLQQCSKYTHRNVLCHRPSAIHKHKKRNVLSPNQDAMMYFFYNHVSFILSVNLLVRFLQDLRKCSGFGSWNFLRTDTGNLCCVYLHCLTITACQVLPLLCYQNISTGSNLKVIFSVQSFIMECAKDFIH